MKKLVDPTKMEGYQDAIDNGDWATPRFGGVWQGITYAVLVVGGYLAVQDSEWHLLPWIMTGIMYWVITKYDSICVTLWNRQEYERVMTEFITDNIQTILEDSEVSDSKENLDGTNGET